MSKSKSTALTVTTAPEFIVAGSDLSKYQAAIVRQIEMIGGLGIERSQRAIYAGILLTRVRNSLKHGAWGEWQRKHVKILGRSSVNHYMRLAAVFIESKQVGTDELLAIGAGPQKKLIDAKGAGSAKGVVKSFQSKLTEFVGDKDLSTLLDEHGIKDAGKIGGAREAAPARLAPPDAEALYQQSRDELGLILCRAEEAFLKENRLQHLAGHPEEVLGVVSGLRALADKVEAAAQPLIKV